MDIPQNLLNQLEEGNVVLFLGAGASHDAKHPKGDKIPDGKKLAQALATKFLDASYIHEPLTHISELAASETDLFTMQTFIYQMVSDFKAADFHKIIPTFKWKSIYTTNYDLIIENAYDKTADKIQDLSPVIRNTRVQQIFKTANTVPYYKLHGCLSCINDPKLPLILTPEQYLTHLDNRDRLFDKLAEEAFNYTFLFVGYSFGDNDIRAILHKLEKEKEGRPRFYMVGPFIKEAEERLWEGKKITSIRLTFKDFLETIDKKISKNVRRLSKARPVVEAPIFNKFVVNVDELKPSESFLNFIENDIDFIHSSLSSPHISAKEFYKGYFENWDPIIRNLDVDRSLKDAILSEAFLEDYYSNDEEGQFFFLIKGFAGSGKSVLLKRLAWDAGVSFDRLCIVYKPNTVMRYDNISELYNYSKQRIYIFLDNVLSREDEIIKLFDKAKKDKIPITVIGTERTNLWNIENNEVNKYLTLSYKLEYLNDKEIESLLQLLTNHNSLGFLESKSQEERIRLLSYQAGRELLVALYEATHGKPFRDIIKDEYDKIANSTAKSLYLTVCILHRLGSSARAGLISRVHGITFDRFKKDFFKPLEFIVFDRKDYKINDYVYQTRHPHIADIVFEMVLTDQQARHDEYVRILNYLDIDFDSDRNAFVAMTNAKKLLEIFPDRSLIQNIFTIASKRNRENSKLLQQQSIFSIETNHLDAAELFIKEAYKISQDDPIILHTFAELEYKKSERAKAKVEKEAHLKQAITLSESLLKEYGPSPHAFHSLLKSLISKLELIIPSNDVPTIERLIKDIEKKFKDARQHFPYQEFILEAEARFNSLMHNTPEAIGLLKKAHDINKASPFIASRLSTFYENNGNIDDALQVLTETIKYIPGDKDINYEYARILALKNPNNLIDITYYLRRSFTEGDNRYQAQFWYARALYLSNEFEQANAIFKKLGNISLDPEIKRKAFGLATENSKSKIFYGRISTVEYSFGFLRRDLHGDGIYFYRYEGLGYDWDKFKSGRKVSFNLAFNYRGPIAINIKLLEE